MAVPVATGPVEQLDTELKAAEDALSRVEDSAVVASLRDDLTVLTNKSYAHGVRDFGAFSGQETNSPELHRDNVDELRGQVAAVRARIDAAS